MKMNLLIAGQQVRLRETRRNSDLLEKLLAGTFPGFTEFDCEHGTGTANLSKDVPFAVVPARDAYLS